VTLLTIRLGEVFLFIILAVLAIYNNIIISTRHFAPSWVSCLVVLAFTKRAQMPFSGWLPKAIRAPTPTRALVHSSTLVTAGLVLIIVYRELIFNSFVILLILVAGFLTIVSGSVLALVENSVKRTVAYSTLSQIGLGMMVVGLGSHYVGLIRLISHGLAKSLLFIQIGYLIHRGINQQGVRGWQMVGSVEGLMRIQLLCSLFSLCGIMFFGGMETKEELLSLI